MPAVGQFVSGLPKVEFVDDLLTPVIENVVLKEAGGAFKRSAHLQMYLPESLPCFVDHFPEFPLVPAFVQLEWMRQFSVQHLDVQGALLKAEKMKFLAPLLPQHRFEVDLAMAADEHVEVEFLVSHCSANAPMQICTKGSLYFERIA